MFMFNSHLMARGDLVFMGCTSICFIFLGNRILNTNIGIYQPENLDKYFPNKKITAFFVAEFNALSSIRLESLGASDRGCGQGGRLDRRALVRLPQNLKSEN